MAPGLTKTAIVQAALDLLDEAGMDGLTVRALRAAGMASERLVGELAFGLGLAETSDPVTPRDLARACAGKPIVWRQSPWPVPHRRFAPTSSSPSPNRPTKSSLAFQSFQ